MKRIVAVGAVFSLFALGAAVAQQHWTEGPVWEVSFYRTQPGQFDTYMEYLRAHYVPIIAEVKKQGLILDSKVYIKTPSGPDDWDIAIATLHSSYAKALDFNQADEDKADAIQAAHWKTSDEKKQQEMSAPRLSMRTSLGTDYVREVNLKPMP